MIEFALLVAFATTPADKPAATPALNATAAHIQLGRGVRHKSHLRSARGRDMSSVTRGANGDAYAGAVLGQNTGAVFFLDDLPDDFLFGNSPQPAGANLITGDTTQKIDVFTDLGDGMIQIEVHFLTDSVTDWLPADVDPDGSGDVLTDLRVDVGAFAADEAAMLGPDAPIQLMDSDFDIISVEAGAFINGELAGSGPVGPENQDNSNGLGAAAIFGDAAGAGVDEIAIFWVLDLGGGGGGGPTDDCDGDGVSDAEQIANDPSLDCDDNGVLDSCQIADNPSLDLNENGIIDGCELPADCDNNGVPDIVQIAADPSLDCDGDGVLDSCQIAATPALDLNGNGIIDGCELESACPSDVTGNGVVNSADLAELLGSWGACP